MNTTVDCQQLVGSLADAVVVADEQGRIVLWNGGAQRIFGHTEAEALGQSLDLIIPERLRKRHNEGYEHSMATGTTRYGAGDMLKVPAQHKDGRALSIAFTVSMLRAPDGRVSGVAAVIRDETTRFADERAQRKRIAELEAQLAAR